MAKIEHLDHTRKAYEALQPFIKGTLFDAFFQRFSPFETYNTIEATLIIVNIEAEVSKGQMSLRRISTMFSAAQILMRTLYDIHTAIFLPDFSHNLDIYNHVDNLTDTFNDGTLVVILDDLMQFAAIEGGWDKSFYNCLNSLKRVYWQLFLQEGGSNKEMAVILAA